MLPNKPLLQTAHASTSSAANPQPVGYSWLIQHFGLEALPLAHASYIAGRAKLQWAASTVKQTYPASYRLKDSDSAVEHLLFALKYDGVAPDVLTGVFRQIPQADIGQVIAKAPGSKYVRLLGFWYEFFNEQPLALAASVTQAINGGYVSALDEAIYYTNPSPTPPLRNSRWRVWDNLLGTRAFCPFVRRDDALEQALAFDLSAYMGRLSTGIPPATFRRAIDYLYTKETKSSNEIEGEHPSSARLARFVQMLAEAGKEPVHSQYAESAFTRLQNTIVDPRYAEHGYRTVQNYVGQSSAYGADDQVHYACPAPDMVAGMMDALAQCEMRSRGLPALLRAALLAWGFVFIHPYEDGNGRIHRFLIHDVLARDGFVPAGLILPVSAHMLAHMTDYDRSLEAHSRPIMRMLDYRFDAQGKLCIANPADIAPLWRYPSLNPQVAYLAHVVQQTAKEDLVQELLYLRNHDRAIKAMQAVVDAPDKTLNLLIRWLHQNSGQLSNTKRQHAALAQLTPLELEGLVQAFQNAFFSETEVAAG